MAKMVWIYPNPAVAIDGIPAVAQQVDEKIATELCAYHCGDDYAFSRDQQPAAPADTVTNEEIQ